MLNFRDCMLQPPFEPLLFTTISKKSTIPRSRSLRPGKPIYYTSFRYFRLWKTAKNMAIFCYIRLLGGWATHLEKYARQLGSFPQDRGENTKCVKPPSPKMVYLPLFTNKNYPNVGKTWWSHLGYLQGESIRITGWFSFPCWSVDRSDPSDFRRLVPVIRMTCVHQALTRHLDQIEMARPGWNIHVLQNGMSTVLKTGQDIRKKN